VRAAIIPARGGSKRIPRKNVRSFAGKPMIAHSILCARDSGLFERVIVSTDDAEIARVARDHGAEVPFMRPAELSDDHTGTTDVVAHAVGWLQDHGATPEAVCCIYATAPFLRHEDLRAGLAALTAGAWDYAFAAATFAAPVYRAFQRAAGGGLEMLFPQHFNTRSQDLPQVFHDAGQFYWGTPAAWLGKRRVFGPASTVVMIPRWRVHDIDTEEDWTRAELFAASLATQVGSAGTHTQRQGES